MKDINKDFHKLSLKNFLRTLEYVINEKTKVSFYLLEKMRITDNTISITIQKVADDLDLSYKLVHSTFKILIGEGFMRNAGLGTYMINPNILYKGKGSKSGALRAEYSKLEMLNKNKDVVTKRSKRKTEASKRKKELEDQNKSRKEINSVIKKEFKDLYN